VRGPSLCHGAAGYLAFAVATVPLAAWALQRAVLPLTLNGVVKGEVLAVLRNEDVLVRSGDLEAAGLQNVAGRRESIGGETFVSLGSLAPALRYELDPQALALNVTAEPTLLASTALNLGAARPSGIDDRADPSAFFNYGVTWRDFGRVDPFGEAGLSVAGSLLSSPFLRTRGGDLARGLSSLTMDERQGLRRWVIGDSFAGAGGLGGSAFIGGLSVARNFSLNPYFVRYPTFGLSGAVLTPSTVDVYVNDVFIRREELPPGPFELRNLPATAGSGATRFVIRDALGRQQDITSPYYLSTSVLAQGLSEYGYSAGLRRDVDAGGLGRYSSPVFLGQHRIGVTDSLTTGLRLEAASALVSGGPAVNLRLPLGELELAGAASHDAGVSGAAGSIAYGYVGRRVSFGSLARGLSPRYSTVSLTPEQDRALIETSAFAGFQLSSRATVTVFENVSDFRDKGWMNRPGVSTTFLLTKQASLFLSVSRLVARPSGSSDAELTAFAGISYYFGSNTTGELFHEQADARGSTGIELQRTLGAGTGFGYRLQGRGGDGTDGMGGMVEYQGPWGRYEIAHDRLDGKDATTVSAAGGVVAIGGSLHATRPVEESFALVRVPGVSGVRSYLSNQEVGRTDSRGDLLVPNLLPYYGNRLAIADVDVPFDYTVGATERLIAPPHRGGAVVSFPVTRIRRLTGSARLEVDGKDVTPAYGRLTVTVDGVEFASPVGKKGEFYLEDVPAGRHLAALEYRGVTCSFTLEVPATEDARASLGTVRCAVPAGAEALR